MFNYNRYDRQLGFRELQLNRSDLIVSKTDLKGVITYANPSFLHISGYTTDELVGQNHNIVRHPDMPRSVFGHMWNKLSRSQPTYCYIKNLAKDGSFYWLFAYVVPDFDAKGNVVGYHSERRAPNPKAIDEIANLYEKIKKVEIAEGLEAGMQYLDAIGNARADSCESYIFNLQNQD